MRTGYKDNHDKNIAIIKNSAMFFFATRVYLLVCLLGKLTDHDSCKM